MTAGSRTRNRAGKAEQSRATRERIVRAATTLFLRDGFLTTTMSAIATEAGVAVQTLYLSFGSKTAILQACFDDQLLGGAEGPQIPDQDWFATVRSDPDGPRCVRLFCEQGRVITSRAAPIFGVMRSAAADPEIAEMIARNKGLREGVYRQIAEHLATLDGFADGMDVDDALVILYGVVSEDSYLLMGLELGWSAERWQQWTTDTCLMHLFPDAPRG